MKSVREGNLGAVQGPRWISRVGAAAGSDRLRPPLADRHGALIAQLIIAWTIARPGITCVLCGARNAAQARDNAQAGQLMLSPDELAEIERAVAPK